MYLYNKQANKQRGFSTACVLVTVALITVIGFFGYRLGGSFIEHRILSGSMNDVALHDDFATASKRQIVNRISEAVRRNSGMNESTLDINKILYVVKRDGQKVIGVNYEVATGLLYNISALMHFKHESRAKLRY
jgi:hypothetical protein